MTDGKADASGETAAAEATVDRLSALQEDLLQHILSFLPSGDAVQTCVLARHYREQWKSVPAIRITGDDAMMYETPSELNRFVNCLLIFRHKLPLNEVELNSFEFPLNDDELNPFEERDFRDAVLYLEPWVRYCLSLKPRKLCLSTNDAGLHWVMPKGLITYASNSLTVLELTQVEWDYDLDFSGCEKLMDLKLMCSSIFGERIFSPSLKHLRIMCCLFGEHLRCRIAVPNLISLLMDDCLGVSPLLESMPFLLEGYVKIQHSNDRCKNNYVAGDCEDESCLGCYGSDGNGIIYGNSNCVIQALYNAKKLELTARPEEFIFRRDLAQCPMFRKLKTLLLNEWCLTANHDALICLLQHSPVLEKLILQVHPNPYHLVEVGANYNLKKQSLNLKDLTLEVKCAKADDRIHRILEDLCSFGLLLKNIKIEPLPLVHYDDAEPWYSGSFSFEQKP